MKFNLTILLLLISGFLLAQTSSTSGEWTNTSTGWSGGNPGNTGTINVIHPKSLLDRNINISTDQKADAYYNGNASGVPRFPERTQKGFWVTIGGKYIFGGKTSGEKAQISTVSSTLTASGSFTTLFDNQYNNAFSFNPSSQNLNVEIFRITLAQPKKIDLIKLFVNQTFSRNLIVEGSFSGVDNPSTWVALSGTIATSTVSNTISLPLTLNLNFYKYYRIRGASSSTITNTSFREIELFSESLGFLTNLTSASTASNNIIVETPSTVSLQSQGITEGSFLQVAPFDNFSNSKFYGSGLSLPSGAGQKFNPILGRVSNPGSLAGTSQTAVIENTGSNYNISESLPYSGSVLIDPITSGTNNRHDLILFGSAGGSVVRPSVIFRSGISNIEGTLGIIQGDLTIESGATFVIGPTECSYCDPNDPFYPSTQAEKDTRRSICLSTYPQCYKDRVRMDEGAKVTIEKGGRMIVYGNLLNVSTSPGFLKVDGAVYIVGDLKVGAQTDFTSSDPTFASSDLYATGSFQSVNGASAGSIEFFGSTTFNECSPGPCSASVNSCGWSVRTSPAGALAYCSGKILTGQLVNSTASTTYTWERFTGTAWSTVAGPTVAASTSIPSYTLNATTDVPPVGQSYYYRLKGEQGTGSNYCVTYSASVQVINSSSAKSWKGGDPGGATDWTRAGNWCTNQVPTSVDDVILDYNQTNRPLIPLTGVASARTILVKTGPSSANLDLNTLTNDGTLNLFGDLYFENNSQLNSGSGSNINFKRTGFQTLTHEASATVLDRLKFENITVDAGSELLLPSSSFTPLQVNGNITVNGQLKPGESLSSLVKFTGGNTSVNVASSPALCEFDQVILEKSTGTTLTIQSGSVGLTGLLAFAGSSSGNISVNAAANFVVKSGSKFSALNGAIGNTKGNNISGNITVERFMPQANGGTGFVFRYLGLPVTAPLSNPPEFFYAYSWVNDPNNAAGGYYAYSYPSLRRGEGYGVYYNDALSKWSVKGPLNQGDIRLICPSGIGQSGCVFTEAKQGWYLLSNPYPHPVYWGSSTAQFPNTGLGATPFSSNFLGGQGWTDWCNARGISPCPTNSNDSDGPLSGGFLVGSGISHVIAIMDNSNLDENQLQRLRLFALDGWGSINNQFEPNLGWYGRRDLNGSTYEQTRRITDGIIAPGQSFWVYSYGISATAIKDPADLSLSALNQSSYLILTESAKDAKGNSGEFYRNASVENASNPQQQVVETSNSLIEIAAVQNGKEDIAFITSLQDSRNLKPVESGVTPKFFTMDLGVYTVHEQTNTPALHQEVLFDKVDQKIFLSFTNLKKGKVELTFNWKDNFIFRDQLYLNDVSTGQAFPLSKGFRFEFDSENSEGEVQQRFFISMEPNTASAKSESALMLFPNPARDRVTVRLSDSSVAGSIVKVIDSSGQEIYNVTAESDFTIDIQNWPAGIYFISLKNSEKIYSGKFIKIR